MAASGTSHHRKGCEMSDELPSPYKEMAEIVALYRIVTGKAERDWIAARVQADDAGVARMALAAQEADFPGDATGKGKS